MTPHVEAPPPGETGTELTGSDAIAAIDDALQAIVQPARAHLTLKDIDVTRVGRWVVLKVKYRGKGPDNEVTVRISRAWATVLTGRLQRVLGL
jgi:hypothetical protein